MALEAVGAALSGGRADHEAVGPLWRGGRRQADALLRSPRVQPGHWRRLDRQGGHCDGNWRRRDEGARTGVDERDEEEEEQRAEGDGADSGPRGRH